MVGCICQGKGTVCLDNYHLGNYRAHAQLAIKYSILLQRSLKQLQTRMPVQRGTASALPVCRVMEWLCPGFGDLYRRSEVHSGRCPCCSPGLKPAWCGGDHAQYRALVLVCRAGNGYVTGIRGLPLSYGTVGGGWVLQQGSRNLPLLLRDMMKQLHLDTLVCSLGICSKVWSGVDHRSSLRLQLHRSHT